MTSLGIPGAVLSQARRVAGVITTATGAAVDADQLLTGRAALLGWSPQGRTSAGGATRLLPSYDGWCALTLSRSDDIEAVPALLETDAALDDPWPALTGWVRGRSSAEVTGRARLLGIPAASLGETGAAPPRIRPLGPSTSPRDIHDLLVADLSVMWAGPLCGQLLARAGATVVKLESPCRPDGTRAGSSAFFDWMNGGKLSYAIDFDNTAEVRSLLEAADVVITSSRPAALTRRGLGPDDVAPRKGRTWVQITGHGTDGERSNWVAFGDDAAVAGGLVEAAADGPVFCGDAIADPLTGLEVTRALLESTKRGGGEMIEISLAATAADYAALPGRGNDSVADTRVPHAAVIPASPLGADNAAVRRLIADRERAPC